MTTSTMGLGATTESEQATPKQWLVALAGFLCLYAPVYWYAQGAFWHREEHAHAPMILAISGWLVYQQLDTLKKIRAPDHYSALGWGLLAIGLVTYLLGRVMTFSIFEFASQPTVAAGLVLMFGGRAAFKALWFPVFFLVFMIPLPGSFVDAATGTLKQWVSIVAEHLLAWADYPVGRTGVMLTVGQYQLLVADACSGLHSMFTLTAMGMLIMYIKARSSLTHQIIMLSAILPIAFAANIVRVLSLVLITYYLGDEAGQGFMHGAAGIVVVVAGLLAFIGLDGLLALFLFSRKQQSL